MWFRLPTRGGRYFIYRPPPGLPTPSDRERAAGSDHAGGSGSVAWAGPACGYFISAQSTPKAQQMKPVRLANARHYSFFLFWKRQIRGAPNFPLMGLLRGTSWACVTARMHPARESARAQVVGPHLPIFFSFRNSHFPLAFPSNPALYIIIYINFIHKII